MNMMLTPLGAVYGALTRARLALYSRGLLSTESVAAPVISVGNMTTGGTGKTPLVEYLAKALAREGLRRVCILTRGYGRANPKERVLVSDGERVLVDAIEGGDEPLLLAESLKGMAAVVSDARRAAAARWALENLKSKAFILDDGFQHLALARDLDIVTVDGTKPWGGGRLLPRGRLREPLEGLARADCIVITRANQTKDLRALRAELEHLGRGRPVFISRTRTSSLSLLSKAGDDEILDAASHGVAAFCAIGNPQAFFDYLRSKGYNLLMVRAFPDHHIYRQSDVDEVIRGARASGAQVLLTTAKDAVKLRNFSFELPCYVLEVEIEIEEEESFLSLVRQAISKSIATS